MSVSPQREGRQGMTLLEVVLALAILAISMAFLAQLVGIGIRSSKEARMLTQGQLYAESIITEMVAGSIQAGGSSTVPNDPNWQYQSQMTATSMDGVVQVVVTLNNVNDELGTTITLARLMRDPSLAIPVDEAATDSTSDTSSMTDIGGTSL
ncbi:MAG: prepilin-type N-terminal cleavage/methylation domain-containing protein [Planctomycetales bacterium]|nr:prepilin-type N-terminal cleavage/methylation domain-containing protein [Planctomycetales bacterium]